MNKGENSYKERQSVENAAEFYFELYCAEKEYKLNRIGFNEKNANVDNFFKLNKYLRNIPDYVVNTPNRTFVVNVKGTGNFKQKEYEMLDYFEKIYSTDDAPLVYAFCFTNKNPILVSIKKIKELWAKSTDKTWSDGVVYRNLGI